MWQGKVFTNLGGRWDMNSKDLTRSRSLYWFPANVCSTVENTKLHHLSALHQGTALNKSVFKEGDTEETWIPPGSAAQYVLLALFLCYFVIVAYIKISIGSGWKAKKLQLRVTCIKVVRSTSERCVESQATCYSHAKECSTTKVIVTMCNDITISLPLK